MVEQIQKAFFFFLKDLCSIFLSQCEQEFSVVAPESRKLQLCCTSHMFGRSEHRECGKKFALNIKLEMEKVIMTKKKYSVQETTFTVKTSSNECALCMQFLCWPCEGGVYIALLWQCKKKREKEKKSLRRGWLSYLIPYYLHLPEKALWCAEEICTADRKSNLNEMAEEEEQEEKEEEGGKGEKG